MLPVVGWKVEVGGCAGGGMAFSQVPIPRVLSLGGLAMGITRVTPWVEWQSESRVDESREGCFCRVGYRSFGDGGCSRCLFSGLGWF